MNASEVPHQFPGNWELTICCKNESPDIFAAKALFAFFTSDLYSERI
jgi:hypothetical protein